jgi:hypothetical protein
MKHEISYFHQQERTGKLKEKHDKAANIRQTLGDTLRRNIKRSMLKIQNSSLDEKQQKRRDQFLETKSLYNHELNHLK